MPNLTSVSYVSGALSSTVSGTVSTLDNLITSGGTANPVGIAVQGMTSGIPQPVNLMSGGTALSVTSGGLDVNIKAATGVNPNGQAVMSASAPVVIASNQSAVPVTTPVGRVPPTSASSVVINTMSAQFVSASTSAGQLGTSGGATDYLDSVLIIPGAVSAGSVSLLWDGTNTRVIYSSGTLPSTIPFVVNGGFVCGNSGGFKITTGTNVTAIAIGNFT